MANFGSGLFVLAAFDAARQTLDRCCRLACLLSEIAARSNLYTLTHRTSQGALTEINGAGLYAEEEEKREIFMVEKCTKS